MRFEPIAIVGRGSVLPDALDPDTFWTNIAAGRVSLGHARQGRWKVPHESMLTAPGVAGDGTWSDVGGYVRGFESVFDPGGFAIDAREVKTLDRQFQWVLHGVRAALREADEDGFTPRAGLVLGNLSFPSVGMAEYAEHVWMARDRRPDARNRFMSGLPAHLAAKALGLGAGAFALDAACASSLYAIKLACDRLHDRTADLMVAGAVNCADDLFIHIGFSALSALSRTGRSRPFHREADGLVPAGGAAFGALMRLAARPPPDRPVLGVILGVGMGHRRAADSAFGFGGNNAHLIVDAWQPPTLGLSMPVKPVAKPDQRVAIVAVGSRVGTGDSTHDLRHALFTGTGAAGRRETIDVALEGLPVPPLDLRPNHGQQLLILEAAREAVAGIDLPRERTMVLVGMGCDAEVARYGARWRRYWRAPRGSAPCRTSSPNAST